MFVCLALAVAIGAVLGWRARDRRARIDQAEALADADRDVSDLCDALMAANVELARLNLALFHARADAARDLLTTARYRLIVVDASTGRTVRVSSPVPYVVALANGIAVHHTHDGLQCSVEQE